MGTSETTTRSGRGFVQTATARFDCVASLGSRSHSLGRFVDGGWSALRICPEGVARSAGPVPPRYGTRSCCRRKRDRAAGSHHGAVQRAAYGSIVPTLSGRTRSIRTRARRTWGRKWTGDAERDLAVVRLIVWVGPVTFCVTTSWPGAVLPPCFTCSHVAVTESAVRNATVDPLPG